MMGWAWEKYIKNLVWKPEGETPLKEAILKCEDNIKTDLKGTGCEAADRIR
jgi:hypothetical protein